MYLKYINQQLIKNLKKIKDPFIYGQNINSGTLISGLSRNIEDIGKKFIHNTPNCEYSMIGAGFGMMIAGGNSIYFAKQLDFMLLGSDHFVNTLNSIKTNNQDKKGSFKLVLFVCDQGFQGSQSSFNNIDDLSSLAQIDTYQINTKFEAENVMKFFFKKKGFSILSIGQRLSRDQIFDKKPLKNAKDFSFIQYFKGEEATIICSNFSFKYALELKRKIERKKNKKVGIINSNFVAQPDVKFFINKIKNQKKIIFISDTKSINHRFYKLASYLDNKVEKKYIFREDFDWSCQLDQIPNSILNGI
ncbi:hypothetical protein OAP88_00730 [Candidatus Pelagibacter sp.]|nr:hypothetical protein [Candidatus Pelagibacter sp.]